MMENWTFWIEIKLKVEIHFQLTILYKKDAHPYRRIECSSCNHLHTGENFLDYILCLFDEYTFHE